MTHPFVSTLPSVCPPGLLARARALARPPRVALVNAGAPVPLAGLAEAVRAGQADPVLIGDPAKIRAAAAEIGWDIDGVRIVDAPHDHAAPAGAALAVAGEVDAIMKGQIHSSTFLKGLLPSAAGLRGRGDICAHLFHLTVPGSDCGLIVTDAALNAAPDMATRQAALTHAVRLARHLGVARPRAGVLAASEDVTPGIPSTGEAAEIAAWAATALPEADVQGPMALDLILSRAAAEIKGFTGPVPGEADIILVPEITTGNALVKMMMLGQAACAAGVVMGARVPLILTSRSQPAADRLASVALAAIVAGMGAGA
jgi:phosphate acetyltransferase